MNGICLPKIHKLALIFQFGCNSFLHYLVNGIDLSEPSENLWANTVARP